MSVKIPPMSPKANFELSGADLKSIVLEEVKRRMTTLYGEVEVTVRFHALEMRNDADVRDDDVSAMVEFIVKPKTTRSD